MSTARPRSRPRSSASSARTGGARLVTLKVRDRGRRRPQICRGSGLALQPRVIARPDLLLLDPLHRPHWLVVPLVVGAGVRSCVDRCAIARPDPRRREGPLTATPAELDEVGPRQVVRREEPDYLDGGLTHPIDHGTTAKVTSSVAFTVISSAVAAAA